MFHKRCHTPETVSRPFINSHKTSLPRLKVCESRERSRICQAQRSRTWTNLLLVSAPFANVDERATFANVDRSPKLNVRERLGIL